MARWDGGHLRPPPAWDGGFGLTLSCCMPGCGCSGHPASTAHPGRCWAWGGHGAEPHAGIGWGALPSPPGLFNRVLSEAAHPHPHAGMSAGRLQNGQGTVFLSCLDVGGGPRQPQHPWIRSSAGCEQPLFEPGSCLGSVGSSPKISAPPSSALLCTAEGWAPAPAQMLWQSWGRVRSGPKGQTRHFAAATGTIPLPGEPKNLTKQLRRAPGTRYLPSQSKTMCFEIQKRQTEKGLSSCEPGSSHQALRQSQGPACPHHHSAVLTALGLGLERMLSVTCTAPLGVKPPGFGSLPPPQTPAPYPRPWVTSGGAGGCEGASCRSD